MVRKILLEKLHEEIVNNSDLFVHLDDNIEGDDIREVGRICGNLLLDVFTQQLKAGR